jgi:hypothetical protein
MPKNAAMNGDAANMKRVLAAVVKVMDQIKPLKAATSPQAPRKIEKPFLLKFLKNVTPSLAKRYADRTTAIVSPLKNKYCH